MKIDEIKSIVQLMSDHDLTEFKVEAEEMHLCIKRAGEPVVATTMAMPSVMPIPALAAPAPPAPSVSADAEELKDDESTDETIDSPIVGTFYTAPSPEQDAFVSIGSAVTADTVVCIIEAMKVMNEIKAEKAGTIKKILVDNTQAVEFGQPLFVIE